jgi:hypothetical protein
MFINSPSSISFDIQIESERRNTPMRSAWREAGDVDRKSELAGMWPSSVCCAVPRILEEGVRVLLYTCKQQQDKTRQRRRRRRSLLQSEGFKKKKKKKRADLISMPMGMERKWRER